MKALSIRQPWAWLIVNGIKPVENRTWSTKYRGPLLIHAGLALAKTSIEEIERRFGVSIDSEQLLFGGVVGVAELVDIVDDHASPFFEGPFGWVLRRPRALRFMPCPGKLGLFEP
jgi:hypothetical protein